MNDEFASTCCINLFVLSPLITPTFARAAPNGPTNGPAPPVQVTATVAWIQKEGSTSVNGVVAFPLKLPNVMIAPGVRPEKMPVFTPVTFTLMLNDPLPATVT